MNNKHSRHAQSRAVNTRKRAQRNVRHSTTAETHGDTPLWSPATSQPGEIFTPLGTARSAGAAARGLRDWRRNPLRGEIGRQMRWLAATGALIVLFVWVLDHLLR